MKKSALNEKISQLNLEFISFDNSLKIDICKFDETVSDTIKPLGKADSSWDWIFDALIYGFLLVEVMNLFQNYGMDFCE